jgi:hypothetical protein
LAQENLTLPIGVIVIPFFFSFSMAHKGASLLFILLLFSFYFGGGEEI